MYTSRDKILPSTAEKQMMIKLLKYFKDLAETEEAYEHAALIRDELRKYRKHNFRND